MNRKIIYSPGYGAGWVSWHSHAPFEAQRFMLEYKPFIEYLEKNGPPVPLYLVEKFEEEYRKRFGDDTPYIGGLDQAKVMEVSGRIRINEYDGHESIEIENEYEGWL